MNDRWIIIASGPSMALIDMEVVRQSGWRVMVVNNSWQLAPWGDVLYAGDGQWWSRYGDAVQFEGEKWTWDAMTALRRRLHLVIRKSGRGLCRESRSVHSGGNSGYQAVNLAWHFGMRRGILLGFDMHRRDGGHWHGEHDLPLSAPQSHIAVWRREFPALALDLEVEGVQVINATPGTALDCFPVMSLEDALCSLA